MSDTASKQTASQQSDPWSLPLETLDPSDGIIFQNEWHHEYFKRLRQEDPVHWSPTGPTGPYWSITKFNDIVEIEKNHKVFSSDRDIVIGDNPEGFSPTMFISKDQPVHDIQRKAAIPAVGPQRISELEDLIRSRVGIILDSLPLDEEFDWVDRVSIELTTQLLATLFDFPWEDRRLLPFWSDAVTTSETVGNPDADEEERQRVLMECLEYFTKLWHERAAQEPKFDFISLLAHNPNTKNMIDDPLDFLGNIMLLIVGGNDTSRNSISGGVRFLNQFPEEYAKLKADHSLIPTMVSEIIRYQTPLAHMRRTALEDIEFGGKLIKKGDRVVMWYISGNRDEDVIANPNQFIIDRKQARHHLSFGFGIHRCMGNRVAEMQIRVLWEEIMKRFENIEVVGKAELVPSNFVLGYTKLPVKLTGIAKRQA
ncbi:MAG: cytochrome P450 [Pseudoalteromonas tetraodonis]|jgi:cytochrome P450